jgi:hypothetical protein
MAWLSMGNCYSKTDTVMEQQNIVVQYREKHRDGRGIHQQEHKWLRPHEKKYQVWRS